MATACRLSSTSACSRRLLDAASADPLGCRLRTVRALAPAGSTLAVLLCGEPRIESDLELELAALTRPVARFPFSLPLLPPLQRFDMMKPGFSMSFWDKPRVRGG